MRPAVDDGAGRAGQRHVTLTRVEYLIEDRVVAISRPEKDGSADSGDAKPDATFRWTFSTIDRRGGDTFLYANGPVTSIDDENLLFRQTYKLESKFGNSPFVTRVDGAPVVMTSSLSMGPSSRNSAADELFSVMESGPEP